MTNFTININGSIYNQENAKISVLDRGFLYGDSVYEATRTFNRIPLRLNQHLDRLFESAAKIYFSPQLTKEQIHAEVLKTIESNPHPNVNIRIVLTRGTNDDLGLNPELSHHENLVIFVKELKENPRSWYEKGLSLTFYQKETSSKGSLPKTGNYIENMLAHRAAILQGHYDSIMINNDGTVTECTTSNIWIVKDGVIMTPPLSDGVLPGLTRATILNMGPTHPHLKFSERHLYKKDLVSAQECFITSTTREVVPVTQIEDQKISDGLPGKITLQLLRDYRKLISQDLSYLK